MMKCIQTRKRKAGKGEKAKLADSWYADSKGNSKKLLLCFPEWEKGLEEVLVIILRKINLFRRLRSIRHSGWFFKMENVTVVRRQLC